MIWRNPSLMPDAATALKGRDTTVLPTGKHTVYDIPLLPPWPRGMESLVVGMGCFWGAEKAFWVLEGVYVTMVGYAGGFTPNPTYQEVCSGQTGHNEVVRVIFDPQQITLESLIQAFFEKHDPTQGMRQGNDHGTQYRSGLYVIGPTQEQKATHMRQAYDTILRAHGYAPITTEIIPLKAFYYAESDHQQYLAKNPGGYCGLGGTGITCPVLSCPSL
jgi:peptide-methionine (S)-S-oxide reductase